MTMVSDQLVDRAALEVEGRSRKCLSERSPLNVFADALRIALEPSYTKADLC
jgi:hypothetical protein